MKKRAFVFGVITALVFIFSACGGSGASVEIQFPMLKTEIFGIWEGAHHLINRADDSYDSTLKIWEDGDGFSVLFSYSGKSGFNIILEGEIKEDQLILKRESGGFTFAGTYTFTNNLKNGLEGEIIRIHPDNRVYHWEGEFEKYTSEYTGWAEDVEYFNEKLPEKHLNLFFKATEEEFNRACDHLIEIANSVSGAEVFLGLKEILALIDDVHTNIHGFGNYQSRI
jgi:hypothetical protein